MVLIICYGCTLYTLLSIHSSCTLKHFAEGYCNFSVCRSHPLPYTLFSSPLFTTPFLSSPLSLSFSLSSLLLLLPPPSPPPPPPIEVEISSFPFPPLQIIWFPMMVFQGMKRSQYTRQSQRYTSSLQLLASHSPVPVSSSTLYIEIKSNDNIINQ